MPAPDAPTPSQPFEGTERFEVRARLGEGGMGVVYRVFDRDRQGEVALKALVHLEPSAIYRLKREFRALADVTHENLVALHELVSTDDQWFITMELIEGAPLDGYVRAAAPAQHSEPGARDAPDPQLQSREITLPAGVSPGSVDDPASPREISEIDTVVEPPPEPGHARAGAPVDRPDAPFALSATPEVAERRTTVADLERLDRVLAQLAAAVTAIHEAGKLHLDLKPHNVLVTPEGRVVVLDFGLAQRTAEHGGLDPVDLGTIAGTPLYMAPEQAQGGPLTPAADWYAVGVMLYEALTGAAPFDGTAALFMVAKLTRRPRPPSEVVAGVPEALERLCMHLLERDHAARGGAPEIEAYLGGQRPDAPDVTSAPRSGSRFVDREGPLSELSEAFVSVANGEASWVHVRGYSGMGKTAMVESFLDTLRDRGRATVLAGRCHERESVPFKALDGVVDALVQELVRLDADVARALAPLGAAALTKVFPVLRQVPALAEASATELDVPDERELRAAAFRALKEILRRLSRQRAVVVFIDDAHWGDADSAQLLREILGPPEPAPILVVTTARAEADETDTFTAYTAAWAREADSGVHARQLDLEPLPRRYAEELARSLLGSETSDERVVSVAHEAEGSPLFVGELARHLNDQVSTGKRASAGKTTLADVLAARLDRLDAEAHRLLSVIAVAAAPIEQGIALRAAETPGDTQKTIAGLRTAHLVRTGGTRELDSIEVYHDRIREVATGRVAEGEQRSIHRRLASALVAADRGDPERLMRHLELAGDRDNAGRHASEAARAAARALAFDHAASLFRKALELAPSTTDRLPLLVGLGDALQNAGRGGDAGRTFRQAAELARGTEARHLERRAMEQLLVSGHTAEGLDVMRELLGATGLPFSTHPAAVLSSLLVRRAQLKVRGLDFTPKPPEAVDAETLLRLDTCFSVSLGLSAIDVINAASYQALHLLQALAAGDTLRIALGLTLEAGHQATIGSSTSARSRELLDRAESLATDLHEPHLDGFLATMRGVRAFGLGRWQECGSHCERAEATFRARCKGTTWELDTAQLFNLFGLAARGDLATLRARCPEWQKSADARGDLYASTSFRVFWAAQTLLSLADDDPARARADVEHALRRWPRDHFYIQHFYELWSHCLIDLYEDAPEVAAERLRVAWKPLERSLALRMQHIRIQSYNLRAGVALRLSQRSGDRAHWLRVAERDIARLEKERVPWASPHAALLRAGVARVRGDAVKNRRRAEEALRGYSEAGLSLHAAVTHWLLSRDAGTTDSVISGAHAERYMAAHGVRAPERLARAMAPGLA